MFSCDKILFLLVKNVKKKKSESLLKFFFRGQLHNLANEKWPQVTESVQQKMARMAAASAWGLGNLTSSVVRQIQ